ncbi:hypothetical protein ACWCW7_18890 [Nocardia tengchongensis]
MTEPDEVADAVVRLDALIGRFGPLPETHVRALGVSLARGLSALRVLGHGHPAIEPGMIEVTASGPRLAHADSGGGTVEFVESDAAAEVAALARVMVAAGGATEPEALAVGPDLRELLRACLSGQPPPTLEDLIRLLDGPQPQVWLPAEPVAVDPVGPNQPSEGAVSGVPQGLPVIPVPPGRRRLPWIIAAACWAAIVVIAAGTAVALSVRGSGRPTYDPAKATDVCALIDLAPLEKLGGKGDTAPDNSVIESPESKALTCYVSLKHGRVMADLQVGRAGAEREIAEMYRVHKEVTLGTTGEGTSSGPRSDLGENAYYSVTKSGKGGTVGCEFGFIDANLVFSISLDVDDDPGISKDDLIGVCAAQARTAQGRLR